MPTLFQDDLFGGSPAVTIVPDAKPARPRRRLASTTLEAGRTRPQSASQRERERALGELKSNGMQGRTHHELAERTDTPLQTICWTVKWMLENDHAFYPMIGWNVDRGEPIHLKRQGRKVLVSTLYRAAYPPPPQSITEQIARSA
jgi:hypothetical protein